MARWDALGDGFGIESRARPRNARSVGLQGLNPLCVSVSAYIGMTAATVENLPGTGYKSVQMRLRDGLGPFAILRLFPIYPRERSDGRAIWGPRRRSPSLSCLLCEPWERCISNDHYPGLDRGLCIDPEASRQILECHCPANNQEVQTAKQVILCRSNPHSKAVGGEKTADLEYCVHSVSETGLDSWYR